MGKFARQVKICKFLIHTDVERALFASRTLFDQQISLTDKCFCAAAVVAVI